MTLLSVLRAAMVSKRLGLIACKPYPAPLTPSELERNIDPMV